MFRNLLAAAALLTFLAPAAHAEPASATNLHFLNSWVGVYPTMADQKTHKKHPSLWTQPAVQAALVPLLGTARLDTMIKTFGVETPLDPVAGDKDQVWLSVRICVPHDCGANSATVFFNTVANEARVLWNEDEKQTWYAPRHKPVAVDSNEDFASIVQNDAVK